MKLFLRILTCCTLTGLLLMAGAFPVAAREDRAPFITALDALPGREAAFKAGGEWVPYPAYRDRAAWDILTEGYKRTLIERGEELLDFTFTPVPASIYLEYERTRDRGLMHKYDHPNREALSDLILAELAEGEGRFLMKILDGMYYACERTAWSHGQHTSMQVSRRTLPSDDDQVVSLLSAVYAANIAVGWHFFHEEFDRLDPSISKTILSALEKHSFTPYLERDWNWMGWNRKDGQRVNNWNCYCNYFTLVSFLYADHNPERLARAVRRCLSSLDQYMDFVALDGACEEGSFYWTMAGAKIYETARLLADASYGKLDLLHDPQIQNMGLYMAYNYIGDGWIVDFADSDARLGPDVMYRDVFFRYGLDCGCRILSDAALSLMADAGKREFLPCELRSRQESREMIRSLESLRYNQTLRAAQRKALSAAGGDWIKMKSDLMRGISSFCFQSTQVATLRSGKWFLGAKGGGNNVSHGHLDVGSAVLYVDNCPVFIDPGVETYAGTTFGKNRFSQWWYLSDWHNILLINGYGQRRGSDALSRDFVCNTSANTLSCELAAVCPEEAAVKSWVRRYALTDTGLRMVDKLSVAQRVAPDKACFIVAGELFLPGEDVSGYKVKEGEAVIRAFSYDRSHHIDVKITFPKSFTASRDILGMTDPRFISVWGEKLTRLTLTSGTSAKDCTYSFNVSLLR